MKKLKLPAAWITKLDASDIAAAFEEATVDAYDDDELHTGLLTAIENEVEFPFNAKVIGLPVTVVDSAWSKADALGLNLIVEIDSCSFVVQNNRWKCAVYL